jgi:hypothetical protein
MKKQQVRPRVDKELFDEVVDYCGFGETFCDSLKWLIKSSKRNKSLVDRGGKVIHEQNETIGKLNAHIRDVEKERDDWKDSCSKMSAGFSKKLNEANSLRVKFLFLSLIAGLSLGINACFALWIFS